VLYNGRHYEGVPGKGEFLVVESFDEHGIPVRVERDEEFVEVAAAKPTFDLLRSPKLADRAELHWRLSLPLSLFVLGLLAVPLSRTAPREGRYARLGVALFIYLIYTNLLSIGRVWIESGVMSDAVGLWWVHALVALMAVWMLAREGGWFVRARALEVPA
jgi:lipopolysaccharide export system permease protein